MSDVPETEAARQDGSDVTSVCVCVCGGGGGGGDDCQGGCSGKRVWQDEYVFSVDRYSVFCSDSESLSVY